MRKYHGTPISGNGAEIASFLSGRSALVSFANQQDMPVVAHLCSSFVLDNGAFSFWNARRKALEKGKVIPPPDWDMYLLWVYEWHRHPGFDWCLIPDVIDGTFEDNKRLLLQYGPVLPKGVPVYHLHEPLDHLEWIIQNFPHRIALGSSGEWSTPDTPAWWDRMAEILPVLCDREGRPRVPIHGLRMLNTKVFTLLPLSSADSCNAGMNCGDTVRWEGPYKPMRSSQRASVIADRIEYFNSAPTWGSEWK